MATVLTYSRTGVKSPKTAQRVRLQAATKPAAGANPWNLESEWGTYHTTFIRSGSVVVRSSFFGGPQWWSETVPVVSGASYPRLALDAHRRLWLTYERTVAGVHDAMAAASDDDGETFGDPAVAISGGTKPTVAVGHDGTIVIGALVGTALTLRVRGPGDADFGTSFTAAGWNGSANVALVLQDDTFHLQQERGPQARWWLHVLLSGETETSDWWSSDLSKTEATFTRGTS